MGTYDEQHDLMVDVVRSLLVTAINSDFDSGENGWGISPISASFSVPIPDAILPRERLPVLAVYRESEDEQDVGDFDEVVRIGLVIEYRMALTPRDYYEKRWPVLHQVWRKIVRTIRQGSHPSYAEGRAEVLYHGAGIERLVANSTRVAYFPGNLGSELYPRLRGSLVVEWNSSAINPEIVQAPLVDAAAVFDIFPIGSANADPLEIVHADVSAAKADGTMTPAFAGDVDLTTVE